MRRDLFKKDRMKYFFYAFVFVLSLSLKAKTALITGIAGQDGYYLARFLLSKNYEVHGIVRVTAGGQRDATSQDGIHYHRCDLDDMTQLARLLSQIQPDEIYNLAVQSQIHVAYLVPEYSARSNALGALHMLEAIRVAGIQDKTRFFQAASCELFGQAEEIPQRETTPFNPSSSYGVAKLFAYWITANYREAYGMFACNGILFNHESPRRGETFVTRKITRAVARMYCHKQDVLLLGNLNAKKDWGYAEDYVEAMWLMLQQENPEDFVIASGTAHTVREFVEEAFNAIGVNIIWQGEGIDEVGIDKATGKIYVKIDPRYFRPIDVTYTLGDITKAKEKLGWKPKTSFQDLVKIMVRHDLNEVCI